MRTSTFILFAVMATVAYGNIQFSRTVDSVTGAEGTLTLASGCTSSEQYGSNDCTLTWGEKVTATVNATLDKDITQGTTFTVDAKVDGLIPLKFTCPACGGNCSITVPIIKKTVSFALPPCPIKADHIAKTFSAQLPSKSPIPLKSKVTGTVSVEGRLKVEFTAAISPDAVTMSEVVYKALKRTLN